MTSYRALAPAKVNLGLLLGPMRAADARHELVTVMQSISLADEVTLELSPAGLVDDEVICPGVPGPPGANLAAVALAAFRERARWQGPPVRVRIDKRIPVAAGLAGGSADAAAALRLVQLASGLGDERLLLDLAAGLGADVGAQVSPGRWLATGAGERLQALPAPRSALAMLVLPLAVGLSTAAVYAQADRLGRARGQAALAEREARLSASLADGACVPVDRELLHNDLQQAALSLCPQIEQALAQAREAGADLALVSGSGPTVVGLFLARAGEEPDECLRRAQRAAGALATRTPAAVCAGPVQAAFAMAHEVDRAAERR
jgi:4-diphosphocytidyl-2-C-methyl-D-erythritol kinase